MVKKGEFIGFAANMDWDETKAFGLPSTEMQILIEMAKKVKELEAKINELEKR